jgi:hypothetical protein
VKNLSGSALVSLQLKRTFSFLTLFRSNLKRSTE